MNLWLTILFMAPYDITLDLCLTYTYNKYKSDIIYSDWERNSQGGLRVDEKHFFVIFFGFLLNSELKVTISHL